MLGRAQPINEANETEFSLGVPAPVKKALIPFFATPLAPGLPALLSLMALLFSSNVLVAVEDHQRNLLTGNRGAGMGGAYTAIAEDPAGGAYNPAGLVFAKSSEISLTVNSYDTTRTTHLATIGSQPYQVKSESLTPAFVGGTYTFGRIALGWAYLTHDTQDIDQNDQFTNLSDELKLSTFTIQHLEINNNNWGGVSLAGLLGNHLALGLSGYYYRHEIKYLEHQFATFKDNSFVMTNIRGNAQNLGLIVIPGIQVRWDAMSFGIAAKVPSVISNKGALYTDIVRANAEQTAQKQAVASYDSTSLNEATPTTLQIGLAHTSSGGQVVSAEILYHDVTSIKNQPLASRMKNTFNYSLGTELNLTPVVLRLGLFTNNSLNPNLESGKKNQPSHVDFKGITASIGFVRKGFGLDLVGCHQVGTGLGQTVLDATNMQKIESTIDSGAVTITYNN